jgi:hypothetical protein
MQTFTPKCAVIFTDAGSDKIAYLQAVEGDLK